MASHGNSLMRIKNLTAFFDLKNSLETLFTYCNHQIKSKRSVDCSTRLIKKCFLIPNTVLWYSLLENVQYFLIKLDIKPLMHLLEIRTSSGLPKLWTTLSKISKVWVSKSFFGPKIGRNFPKKNSVKNIWLGDQLILMKFFENFDF